MTALFLTALRHPSILNTNHLITNSRGLGNLLGGETASAALQGTVSIQELPLEKIAPNPDQPRKHFEQEGLEELAASLRALGLVQPITVQALPSGSYQIISGERRWRAAQLAGLKTLPAYIRSTQEGELLELALIENIQREDLNAIEIQCHCFLKIFQLSKQVLIHKCLGNYLIS